MPGLCRFAAGSLPVPCRVYAVLRIVAASITVERPTFSPSAFHQLTSHRAHECNRKLRSFTVMSIVTRLAMEQSGQVMAEDTFEVRTVVWRCKWPSYLRQPKDFP